jgi:hypothetical protein
MKPVHERERRRRGSEEKTEGGSRTSKREQPCGDMDPSPERGHEGCLVLHREDDTAEQEEALHVDAAPLPVHIVDADTLADVALDLDR